MAKVELTPAKLAELRQKAEAAETQGPSPWSFVETKGEYHTYCEVHDKYGCQVVEDSTQEEAEHIAAADPATVLALLDELTDVRMALLELAWEFYGRDQTREEIESCCAVMVENERASRKESEATP